MLAFEKEIGRERAGKYQESLAQIRDEKHGAVKVKVRAQQ